MKLFGSPQRSWPLTLLVVGGVVAGLAHALDLRVNTTASMPIGHYREVPARLELNTWVAFCLPAEPARVGRERGYLRRGDCADGAKELVKELAAIPGDRVSLSGQGLVVNGRLIPMTEVGSVNRSGRALAPAPYGEQLVGAAEVWVLGVGRRVSWDSRYYGAVPLDHARTGALPVLTFGANSSRGTGGGETPWPTILGLPHRSLRASGERFLPVEGSDGVLHVGAQGQEILDYRDRGELGRGEIVTFRATDVPPGSLRAVAVEITRHGRLPEFEAVAQPSTVLDLVALQALRERGDVLPRDPSLGSFTARFREAISRRLPLLEERGLVETSIEE